jgi:pimeloyl-ACP methyl ester carboxylesterase
MPMTERAGVALHYQAHGASGDPVLLLMGLGLDARAWQLQLPAFTARHRVIAVDNRGVGRSGRPPGPYSIAEMADDAAAALEHAGIARAHVVGVSMGGMIAQELALRHPARVGALVLAATYARPDAAVADTAARIGAERGLPPLLTAFQPGAFDFSTVNAADVFRLLLPLVFSERFLADHGDFLRSFFAEMVAEGYSVAGFFAQAAATQSHDTQARLPSLTAPTLVITGSEDRLIPPRHSDELARLIPGARLLKVDGGSHAMTLETPHRFSEPVLEFLAAHPLG